MSLQVNPSRLRSGSLPLTVLTLALTGCGIATSPSATSNATTVIPQLRLQGRVHGGQQPVANASIQLYAVGTAGPASASTPLIASPPKTDSSGQFTITGAYNCAGATQVYLVAIGGDAGAGNNTALGLMAALGPCSSLTPSTFINVNELTTVAADYALAPFMSDYAHVGATGTNPSGLVNAFQTSALLVDPSSGLSPTPPSGITIPTATLNTLADILAACVNTSGASSSGCTSLLNATGASETIGAGLALAQSPGAPAGVALFSLVAASTPFTPALSQQPGDLTVAIRYTGSDLASPYGIALDASGSAWVSNEAGRSVVKLPSPSSTFATSSYSAGGLLAPRGLSIDRSGNIWIANTGANNVVELNSSGVPLSGAGFTTGGINTPVAIASDSAGNAWVTNFAGNSVTELSTAGAASGSSPLTAGGAIGSPTSIALDASGNIAVANGSSGQLCLFTSAAVLQSCVSDASITSGTAIAATPGGNVALAGSTTGTTVSGAFTFATTGGTVISGSPFSGGGLTLPVAVAYDGTSNAWFANASSISRFSGGAAVSPAAGLGSMSSPHGIAVDASGNIWTANSGDDSVTIVIGAASPVVTPIAANVGP